MKLALSVVALGAIPAMLFAFCSKAPPLSSPGPARVSPLGLTSPLAGNVVVGTITARTGSVGTRGKPESVTVHVDEVLLGEVADESFSMLWEPLERKFVCGNGSPWENTRINGEVVPMPEVGDRYILMVFPATDRYLAYARYAYDEENLALAKRNIAERLARESEASRKREAVRDSWIAALDDKRAPPPIRDGVDAIALVRRFDYPSGSGRAVEVLRPLSPDFLLEPKSVISSAWLQHELPPEREFLMLLLEIGPPERRHYRTAVSDESFIEATPARIAAAERLTRR